MGYGLYEDYKRALKYHKRLFMTIFITKEGHYTQNHPGYCGLCFYKN
jgi:hypothetical protein